jgi:hypothetical protein
MTVPAFIFVTKHARKRVRERLGLPSRAVVRAAALALRSGVTSDEVRKDLRQYLDAKASQNADIIRVWRGAVFAFATVGDAAHLITAWPLRRELQP